MKRKKPPLRPGQEKQGPDSDPWRKPKPWHYPWSPETGGYRDGQYYGIRPHIPAEPGATHETDNRLCSACGTQRTFQWERGRYVKILRDANCRILGYEEIDDQTHAAKLFGGNHGIAWRGFEREGDDVRGGKCWTCERKA
jgi:hypothetical protein